MALSCGEEREEEPRLISGHYKVYRDLTHNFRDLSGDDQVVQFFSQVLARRDQLEVDTCGPVVVGWTPLLEPILVPVTW